MDLMQYEFRKTEEGWQRRLGGRGRWETLRIERVEGERVLLTRANGKKVVRPTFRNEWVWS
jgi:hypothetical protein